jgi:23S rRNA (uracil1939-C5)-methyltransferase
MVDGRRGSGAAAAEAIPPSRIATALRGFSIDEGFGPQSRWAPEPATVSFGGVAGGPSPKAAFLQAHAGRRGGVARGGARDGR